MALIGLLSDSHGDADATRLGAGILLDHGARMLLHMGDIGGLAGRDVLKELAAAKARLDAARDPSIALTVRVVFGNNDDEDELASIACRLGLPVDHPAGWLEIEGKTLVYTHGDDARTMREAVLAEVDYLIHGHTHRPHDQRDGRTRIINPGALHRADPHSVALLDTARDALTFYRVAPVC
jgi:putative phosphoesterase